MGDVPLTRSAAEAPVAAEPPTPPPPDALAGLAAEREGRERLVTEMFESHHVRLVRLATLLGAEGDAEDVVAEAFCELHRRLHTLSTAAAALPYLRATVVNLTRSRIRRLQTARRHVPPAPLDAESAEAEVMTRDEHRQVVRALDALPRRQREALVLRYWGHLREAEIAEAMGISAGAVKSHVSRGMSALTDALGGRL